MMRYCSYNFGLTVLVMFGNLAKLDSPRRLVQFLKNFQTLLALLILNCTHNRMITYTNWLSVSCLYQNNGFSYWWSAVCLFHVKKFCVAFMHRLCVLKHKICYCFSNIATAHVWKIHSFFNCVILMYFYSLSVDLWCHVSSFRRTAPVAVWEPGVWIRYSFHSLCLFLNSTSSSEFFWTCSSFSSFS